MDNNIIIFKTEDDRKVEKDYLDTIKAIENKAGKGK